MTVHITNHAIDRFIERVAPVSRAEAARIMLAAERAIETAAAFGGRIVRLPSGARLICRGKPQIRVVTVLERGHLEGGCHEKLAPSAFLRPARA
jgi:hypothetical protein